MIGKKINQLATELAPVSTDLTIIGDPVSGVSKKITLAQLGAIFSGAVSFYTNLAAFPVVGDINVIYCAKDTQKLYLWSGSAYTEVFPSQALLDTYQLRSEKGVSNGYASLDSGGKVPISQLPSSIMEYKGMWDAATNTPTLANGTGDTGDVYICNVAGTVNFGAGPITFAVGDYVIYSGSIWQRSSGAVGTVTSVGLSITGDSIGVSNSPITTSGTLALAFAGTSAQYINGAGNLTTFPTLTGFVPYTGATANVDLGTFDLTADVITGATGSYTSSGGGNTLEISHTSGSGIALNITKGGNGEGLYINKTSGTGNAATIVGTLEATTLVKTGGTSSQFLKADGSVDSSTYVTTDTNQTITGIKTFNNITNFNQNIIGGIVKLSQGVLLSKAANIGTDPGHITLLAQGITGTNYIYFADGDNIFNTQRFAIPTTGTYTYTLQAASGTLAFTSDLTGGTVTSVGLSSATSGVTIGSSPITTSGTITLAIATASGSQQGLLSSTDWTTFNNKQNALTNPVTGTGTTNYLPKFTGTSTIGNSALQETSGNIQLDNTSAVYIANSSSSTYYGGLSIRQSGTEKARFAANSSEGAYIYSPTFAGFSILSDAGTFLRLNASGNLGLGVTPSAWISVYKAINIGSQGLIYSRTDTADIAMGLNWYRNSGGAFLYNSNGHATIYAQNGGQHLFYTAPSGTAGNAISFTQAMTLNASGNLSIGNTNDTYRLDVTGRGRFTHTGGVPALDIRASDSNFALMSVFGNQAGDVNWLIMSGYPAAGDFTIRQSDTVNALTLAKTTGAATFSSSVTALGVFNGYAGLNGYAGATHNLLIDWSSESQITTLTATNLFFGTNAQRRMTITSGGNVVIGGTSEVGRLRIFSANTSSTGLNDLMDLTNAVNTGLRFQITGTSDSDQRAYIGTTTSSSFAFGTNSTERMRITSGGTLLVGTTTATDLTTGSSVNVGISLGGGVISSQVNNNSNQYWSKASGYTSGDFTAHFVNGSYVGGISTNGSSTTYATASDYRLKTDLKDFNGLDLLTKIKTYDYEWKADKTRSYGVIAHELQSIINNAVTGVKDGEQMQGVDYSKIVPVNTKAIQELYAIIQKQQIEIEQLKNK